jgi:hypothetical protein
MPTHSPQTKDTNLEVISRLPSGVDFGRGLIGTNLTAVCIDNILTISEVRHAPGHRYLIRPDTVSDRPGAQGRILFYYMHPAVLGVCT